MSAHSLRARFKETVTGAILDAAEELAAEVGVPGTNLQAVAKRAGVAVGTIYNHFEDRNELFVELFTRRREGLLAAVDSATKGASRSGFDTQLEAFVHAVLSYFDTRRTFLRLALDGQTPKPKAGSASNAMEQLALRAQRIVKQGVKEKRLRAEAAGLAPYFLTSAIKAILMTRADSAAPLAGETARVIDLFLNGSAR
ncbi:MAG: TetR family transcriptional regulator [Labilithrix sp.]|nr:TetR family transcriptional regulator [Labilithrix sp.]